MARRRTLTSSMLRSTVSGGDEARASAAGVSAGSSPGCRAPAAHSRDAASPCKKLRRVGRGVDIGLPFYRAALRSEKGVAGVI